MIKPDIHIVIGQHVYLRKAGKNFVGLCPFHEEKTPSFSVNPDKQIFHCFGCGEGGDVIDFVQKIHVCDFQSAIKILGLTNGKYRPDPIYRRKRELVKKYELWKKQRDGQLLDLHRVTLRFLDAASGPGRSDLMEVLEAVQQALKPFDTRDEADIFGYYKAEEVSHEQR